MGAKQPRQRQATASAAAAALVLVASRSFSVDAFSPTTGWNSRRAPLHHFSSTSLSPPSAVEVYGGNGSLTTRLRMSAEVKQRDRHGKVSVSSRGDHNLGHHPSGTSDFTSLMQRATATKTAPMDATRSPPPSSVTTSTGADVDTGVNGGSEVNLPFVGGALAVLVSLAAIGAAQHPTVIQSVQHLFTNPTDTLSGVVDQVQSMGPAGVAAFAAVYIIAEVLAVPATPLTASAGYLFGVGEGTAVVLAAASVAASISFWVGRTLLRDYVEGTILERYPKFKALDEAIGREGFKLMLLIRLSPVFPFALSNYLYGTTSIKFWPYFWGTVLGFLPGTMAYVYTGQVGKDLTANGGMGAEPWYVYAGGAIVLGGLLKLVSDVAGSIIEDMESASDQ